MDRIDQQLLDDFQRDFPLTERPFADLGERLGICEDEVLSRLATLQSSGTISRLGGVFKPGAVGSSTLAAIAVPPNELDLVAGQVSELPSVNHNYAREHTYNLWFVVTGDTQACIDDTLSQIEARTGYEVLDLPLEKAFHIDLGFGLKWN
jgi:DNA-binding Lrp family transcriptional regulator